MTEKPAHLCLTCKFAEWGRIDSATGDCTWEPPVVPLPAAMAWDLDGSRRLFPFRQYLRRDDPITACETYEAKP